MAKKGGGGKGKDKKDRKDKVKKEGKKLSALYDFSGDSIKRKNRNCPKCGPGMFMARHSDRVVCGKCTYTEYNSKPVSEVKKEDEVKESVSEESADSESKESAKKVEVAAES
jgi:ubiquitin-small subunit ribosomal protein S27Ae